MGRQKQVKELMVENLAKRFKTYKNFFLVDYRGLTGNSSVEFRKLLRQDGIWSSVCRNSIGKRAFDKIGLGDFSQHMQGMVMIVYGSDPVSISKKLSSFAQKTNVLQIKKGYVEGQILDKPQLAQLANMPSKQEIIGSVISAFDSPARSFVNILEYVISDFAMILESIGKK